MKGMFKLGVLPLLFAAILFLVPAARAEDVPNCGDALFELGVLRGDGESLALDREFRRDEAAVMLVRLLGAEAEALEQNYGSPFADVEEWAKPYVGYLWEKGLTKGVSDNEFAPAMTADGRQYLTFLLRTLGYNDGGVDFDYFSLEDFLVELNLFAERGENDFRWYLGAFENPFRRMECAELTLLALGWQTRGGAYLADTLIEKDVFTRDALVSALTPLRSWVMLDPKGHVVHGYIHPDRSNTIALPALGVSEETYATSGWMLDGCTVFFDAEGASWFVDNETLQRSCLMSEHRVALVDFERYNGQLYFYEYPGGGSGEPMNICRYDGDRTVTMLLAVQNAVHYDRPNQADYVEVVEERDGTSFYYVLDLESGGWNNLFSAPGAPAINRVSMGDEGYTLLTVRNAVDTMYATFGGRALLDTVKLSGSDALHAEGAPVQAQSEPGKPVFFLDGGVVLRVAEGGTLSVEAVLDRAVYAVCEARDMLYLLAEGELLAAQGGKVGVLIGANILTPLGITDVAYEAETGTLYLICNVPIGHTRYDRYTYCYNFETGRVEVCSASPGRWDGNLVDEMTRMQAYMQKLLDEIYGT